jgi:hypothetical protein
MSFRAKRAERQSSRSLQHTSDERHSGDKPEGFNRAMRFLFGQ